MSVQRITCYVCKQPRPRKLSHEHHKVPRAAGGTDSRGNLVHLCPTCHDNLHRFAEMFSHGKSAEAADLASLEYRSPAPRKRSMDLAQLVAKSFSIPGLDEKSEMDIRVTLPTELVKRLRVLASEHPGENGRPLGAPKFAAMVLTQYLIQKGMWNTKDN